MSNRKNELAERTQQVKEALAEAARAAGRKTEDVSLVAVSKLHPASDIRALAETGQVDFGENYVQEAVGKQEELADLDVRWHFIGGLQSNKAKFVAGNFALVHSVDSRKLANTLSNKALARDAVQDILLQVNIAGEEQKSGISVENLPELADAVMEMDGVRLRGLMTMPPFFDEPERARPVFARLRQLRDELEGQLGISLPHLSMGMTGDFVPAVEEGATLVRIGTRIFGARPPRA
ncbi:Pyridoxal phosphate homeostasis protein [Pseudodesulfovibrio profundus]|uniref:Pyridoxal phosphate homeostasis protein n=1 Tax=Pseudodesulfovibrio profundus TaxID=57320 RepID=A0A2C8F790_9BACT|nr:YggS family pyridoxal phosphate-dependent enzyme [Pseudodesulfovibrio profundus]MBC17347.1 YggS family pyridoxal phosphate-dependent enzyme [Desulfovibrio sp.]SOB58618.1 Pyridoxal phosphate homeostasis protein [Pseudodesulfovibrio profundus]|tara:strand:+ start:225 stop:932 length:708 start_codon:yes stop_codon:yes gene_type:complete